MSEAERALEKAARVIKIALSEAEARKLDEEMNLFLDWLKPLAEFNSENDYSPAAGQAFIEDLRDDHIFKSEHSEIRKAAPRFEDDFYMVPPIIE